MAETPDQIIARQYDRLLLERNTAIAELAVANARAERWKAEAVAARIDYSFGPGLNLSWKALAAEEVLMKCREINDKAEPAEAEAE